MSDTEPSNEDLTEEETDREHEIAHATWVRLMGMRIAYDHGPGFLREFAEQELVETLASLSHAEAVGIVMVALEVTSTDWPGGLLIEIRKAAGESTTP